MAMPSVINMIKLIRMGIKDQIYTSLIKTNYKIYAI